MEAVQIKKVLKSVKFHARIAFRGFYRTMCGAAVAGLIALSIYRLMYVASETGWAAVFDFVLSCATMIVAMSSMYLMGGRKKGEKNG